MRQNTSGISFYVGAVPMSSFLAGTWASRRFERRVFELRYRNKRNDGWHLHADQNVAEMCRPDKRTYIQMKAGKSKRSTGASQSAGTDERCLRIF